VGLSYLYGKLLSDEERFKVLDRTLELGETFWDSTDICKLSSQEDEFRRTGKGMKSSLPQSSPMRMTLPGSGR
jgi:hypothetical protein